MRVAGKIKQADHEITIDLHMLYFKEGKNDLVYSPALDLTGYGKSLREAKDSFETALDEFFRYTIRKGTIEEVLKDLGWGIRKSKRKGIQMSEPDIIKLITDNDYVGQIFRDNPDVRITRKEVIVPAA